MPKLKKIQSLRQLAEPAVKVVDSLTPADLLPVEGHPWKHMLSRVHEISQSFGFSRVETSPIESLDFYQNIGSAADQAIRFDVTANRKFGLRPQNFLSILRAYAANRVFEQERVSKWYYVEPAFASEKSVLIPTYEYGTIIFGEPTAISDAQVIAAEKTLLEELGVSGVVFEINHRGCEACSDYYEEVLSRALQQSKFDLCESCQNLLNDPSQNADDPNLAGMLGVFACANERCQEVTGACPQIIDYLDPSCTKQLTSLLETLDELEIPYQLNPRLFGGGWLSHAVFRLKIVPDAASGVGETSLGVGGRYSRFASKLIGQPISVLSFSLPLSAIVEAVKKHGVEKKPRRSADVFLINLGDLAAKKSLRLFLDLWKNNIRVAEHFGENGIKNQFKLAEKKGCVIALVIGQKEALEGSVILRDVRSGIQEVFSYDRIVEELRKRLQD